MFCVPLDSGMSEVFIKLAIGYVPIRGRELLIENYKQEVKNLMIICCAT
jgi:hypothetical protein